MAAHEHIPLAPDYSGSELFLFDPMGYSRIGVAPVLSRAVARQMKDEAEVQTSKFKTRELRQTPDTRRDAKGGGRGQGGAPPS